MKLPLTPSAAALALARRDECQAAAVCRQGRVRNGGTGAEPGCEIVGCEGGGGGLESSEEGDDGRSARPDSETRRQSNTPS